MNNPNKTSYEWISWIQRLPFSQLLAGLLLVYFSINFVFGLFYYIIHALEPTDIKLSFLDYIYYSFFTTLSIGYGNFSPQNSFGKIVVIVQSSVTALYFAFMITALSANLLFPKNTIHFSTKFIYNPEKDSYLFRIINTHTERLVNPEIRITVVKHANGNVIAKHISVNVIDQIPYLGRHDFSLSFKNRYINESGVVYLNIYEEIRKALVSYIDNDNRKAADSRFRILISISGNYGIQQFVSYKKYYANELEEGKGFEPIKYNEEDQKKWNIRYTEFPDFWKDFNKIIK